MSVHQWVSELMAHTCAKYHIELILGTYSQKAIERAKHLFGLLLAQDKSRVTGSLLDWGIVDRTLLQRTSILIPTGNRRYMEDHEKAPGTPSFEVWRQRLLDVARFPAQIRLRIYDMPFGSIPKLKI